MTIIEQEKFPGCIDSLDCQHRKWENWSIVWVEQFKDKGKNLIVFFEAIADGELCILGTYFGSPGSPDDINILDQFSIYQGVLTGKILPDFDHEIKEH